MALNDLDDVQFLVREGAWELATRRCKRDALCLGLSTADVANMLLALTPKDHRKDYGAAESEFGEVQADAYSLWYDETQGIRCAPGGGSCYYIKLGVHSSDEGECCLVVSFHLDGRP